MNQITGPSKRKPEWKTREDANWIHTTGHRRGIVVNVDVIVATTGNVAGGITLTINNTSEPLFDILTESNRDAEFVPIYHVIHGLR